MPVYIYENVSQITTSWHDGGSVTIVTLRDPNEAWRDYLAATAAEHPSNAAYLDPEKIIQKLPPEDRMVATMGHVDEAVYVFPDSGCC